MLIVLKMQLHPRLKQSTGLNLINMWKSIMQDRKEHHDANSHINYLSNDMDVIH